MTPSAELFTAQDQADLQQIIVRITRYRKQGREQEYDAAVLMVQVRDRGLWEMEPGCKDVFGWIKKHFEIEKRQAQAWMVIGANLERERVVGSTLPIEKLEIVGRSPAVLRDTVQQVAGQVESIKALRAGRDAGIEVLRKKTGENDEQDLEERVQAAQAEVERRALEVDGDQLPASAEQVAQGTAQVARGQLSRLLELRQRLSRGEKVPVVVVRGLADTLAQAAVQARLLADEARAAQAAQDVVDCIVPPKDAVDCIVPPPPAAQDVPPKDAVDCIVPPPPAAQLDMEPLVQAAVHVLNEPARGMLFVHLFFLVGGEAFAVHAQELQTYKALFERNGPLPAGLFAAWLQGLGQPDQMARRLFALRFLRRVKKLEGPKPIKPLSELGLPPDICAAFQAEIDRAQSRSGAKSAVGSRPAPE